MKKIFTLVAALAIAGTAAQAQSILKFDVTDGNGLKGLTDMAVRPGAGQFDVIVPADFDLTNVTVDAGETVIIGEMPKDFTTPQKVTIGDAADNTKTKEYTITLRKVLPATLIPNEATSIMALSAENPVTSWTAETIGWATAAPDLGKPEQVSMGNVGASMVVAFANAPAKIEYLLWVGANDPFAGTYTVDASADGLTWSTLQVYGAELHNNATKAEIYSHELSADIRFVRWTYTVRNGQRVNVNNITAYGAESEPVDPSHIRNAAAEGISAYVADGRLVVCGEVAKAEVYDIAGKAVNADNLGNGLYLVRLTAADGSVATSKVLVK